MYLAKDWMVSQAGSETLGRKGQDVRPPIMAWCKLTPAPGERFWHQEICRLRTHEYCRLPCERGKVAAGIVA